MIMTYKDAVRYIDSFFNYEKNPLFTKRYFKLDRIKALVSILGNPERHYPTIHIAGTKGKGSVASIISHVLKNAGYKVGLYTSPHLKCICERMKINNKDISKKEFAESVLEVKDKIEHVRFSLAPSFFDILTLIAFNYFKKSSVDFGVFEVGLGGRLDSTNIIEPVAAAIASVSYDHTRELGNRLSDIAMEKAGIIKNRVVCVSAPQRKEVLKIIKNKCIQQRSKLILAGKDITYKSKAHTEEKEVFDINGILNTYKDLEMGLLGEHQLINCAVAIGVIETLISKGYKIPKDSIYKGIKKIKWPARLEIVKKKPMVILDCAHNKASAEMLKKAIKRNFRYNKLILILGISKDKDIKGIVNRLAPLADKIILTKADNLRAAEPVYINRFFRRKDVFVRDNIRKAYDLAGELACKNDMILITGSVYLVGDFKSKVNL